MGEPPSVLDLITAALLLAAAVPLLRLGAARPLRREAASRPLLAAAVLIAGAIAGVVAAWAWIHATTSRSLLAGGAGALAVAAWVRARPGYGSRRGLPPGSLGLAASLDAISDQDFYLRAARRWGPVFKMSQLHRPVVCVADLSLGLQVLRAPGDGFAQSSWAFSRLVPGGYLEFMSGSSHARLRAILAPGFTEAAAGSREIVDALVGRELAAMAGAGDASGVDPEPFLDRIAFGVLAYVVLGVLPEGAEAERLRRIYDGLDQRSEIGRGVPRAVRVAFAELTTIATGMVDPMRAMPNASRPRSVLAAAVHSRPDVPIDATLLGNVILLVSDGRTILRWLLRWVLKMRADHPAWPLAMRDEVGLDDADRVEGMATAFVHETLRLHGSPYVYRAVTREGRLGSYRLPRGWLVRICVREAHRRPEVFPDPERFDPRRFMARHHEPSEFLPFSDGAHACFAGDLSMAVARAMVSELALAYDVRTVADGPAEGGNRHWDFWRPSRRWRVAIVPRASEGESGPV